MSPDEYQQAWRAESSRTRVSVDADTLLNAVERNRQEMRMTVSWSDFVEFGIWALLLPVWIFLGVTFVLPWSWYLMVPAIVWSAGVRLGIRVRHKPAPNDSDKPVLDSVKESLALVEYQILTQRNVFRSSQLSMLVAMVIFFAHVSWLKSSNWVDALAALTFLVAMVLGVYAFLFFFVRYVVRKQLEPKRQELLTLLASLGDEAGTDVRGEYPILMRAKPIAYSRRNLILRGLCALVLAGIGFGGIYLGYKLDQGYPKKSPFAAVRWDESQPSVKIGDAWFQLVSLDDLPATEIVAFCQETYGNKWKKRFEEDLVEVLAGMGHEPRDTVTLVVLPTGSTTPRTIEDVPMTAANRQAIRNTNQARERSEQQGTAQNSVSIEGAEPMIAELVPRLRKDKKLVGLAAMVMVDGKVIASAVDGERKKGSGVPLAVGDQWHLGSITKSITSTMIARLVDAGKLEWTTTVGECFPDAPIHEDWKPVTMRQLLTHTSGAPANFSFLTPRDRPARGAERTEARRDAVLRVLADEPDYVPGEKHAYSNLGYTIAGAMVEKTTGDTWEDLVQREVFDPLDLKSAGFGPPRSANKTFEQPRGHSVQFGWKVAASDEDDNTPIIGPAGTVHMSLSDLCAYAGDHLNGELGAGELLSPETYKVLHTPELSDYACGWVKYGPMSDLRNTVYWHNGSNTMWYALVAFVPEKKLVVAVTSNDGDIANAEAAAWEIVKAGAQQIDVGVELPQDTSSTTSTAPFDCAKAYQSLIDGYLKISRTNSGILQQEDGHP